MGVVHVDGNESDSVVENESDAGGDGHEERYYSFYLDYWY